MAAIPSSIRLFQPAEVVADPHLPAQSTEQPEAQAAVDAGLVVLLAQAEPEQVGKEPTVQEDQIQHQTTAEVVAAAQRAQAQQEHQQTAATVEPELQTLTLEVQSHTQAAVVAQHITEEPEATVQAVAEVQRVSPTAYHPPQAQQEPQI